MKGGRLWPMGSLRFFQVILLAMLQSKRLYLNYVVLTRVQDCEESYQEAIYYHTQDIPIPTLNVTLIDQTYQHHIVFLPRFYQTKLHVCLHYEKGSNFIGCLGMICFLVVWDDIF